MGEARFKTICQRYGLTDADIELMEELMTRWKLDYNLEDIAALCEEYKDRPNIGRVM